MMRVTAIRTYSALEVRRIMTYPSMWETVAEDGQDPATFQPDVDDEIWLSIRADDKPIGLYQLQKRNAVTVEIHANMLPKYRKRHSDASGKAALRWVREELPDIRKVIAWVPMLYMNVRAFCEKQGFRLEGTNRASYLKNGRLHDQYLLGITCSEIDKAVGG